ncbi:MAG: hypothetical protein U0520_00185 [Candidatus Saccharimonadales bacterium]
MLKFLLTSWWLYIPIIGVLLYLTRRNNQKIKAIKAQRTERGGHSFHKQASVKSTRIKKAAGKLGLSGAASHLHRSK